MPEQGQLFATAPAPDATAEVPGLALHPDYIDASEEHALLAHVEDGPWENDWRRRIQQYGVGYSDTGGKPNWQRDFPPWLMNLARRVGKDAGFERFPENCVINEYIPPLGIAPHRDYPAFGPTIACISLGSDIILDFVSVDRSERIPVHVPARSLWIITGAARSKWLHGIAPRLNDVIARERRKRQRRVSITFRTAKKPAIVPASHSAFRFATP
jgi:alkylated DNA repair dioxygenase AlkB